MPTHRETYESDVLIKQFPPDLLRTLGYQIKNEPLPQESLYYALCHGSIDPQGNVLQLFGHRAAIFHITYGLSNKSPSFQGIDGNTWVLPDKVVKSSWVKGNDPRLSEIPYLDTYVQCSQCVGKNYAPRP